MSLLRRRPRPTAEELAVIRALLGEGDAADKLVRQVAESVALSRIVSGCDYTLLVQETTEELLIDLDHDVIGEWQAVRDAMSGRCLEFRVVLRRGGFFGALEGRCEHGEWPDEWGIPEAELSTLRPVEISLESDTCDPLLEWLGAGSGELDTSHLHCRKPAAASTIRAVERREGASLPAGYVELLQRSNGLTVRETDLLGTNDLYVTELDGEAWWVVGARRAEQFVVTHRDHSDDVYYQLESEEVSPRASEAVASSARELIRRLALSAG